MHLSQSAAFAIVGVFSFLVGTIWAYTLRWFREEKWNKLPTIKEKEVPATVEPKKATTWAPASQETESTTGGKKKKVQEEVKKIPPQKVKPKTWI
jgi:hypothetical protein